MKASLLSGGAFVMPGLRRWQPERSAYPRMVRPPS